MVDNFMNRLAEKISAQDIIRANSQAESKEAERIKQEAEHYKAQLEEMRQNAKEYKAQLDVIEQNSQKYSNSLEGAESSLKQASDALTKRMDDSDTKIHDIGVQVYRNVQAVLEKNQEKNQDEFKELNRRLEAIQIAIETKNSAVLPVLIVTLIIAGADLVLNILRIIGIL
ncbi:hypothetical protein [Butyrivibrio proteoclasticus]|uniref:hypothetical protein n=1 Tax=Butyrivibrio proteoclasticus TaxID=43305 RepID=UPI00047C6069|nr:hypothetical protein [Butyrivibrio proteoclasticus]